MTSSIFKNNQWSQESIYKKNDVVKESGKFYYCLLDHTSSNQLNFGLELSVNEGRWGGYDTFKGGEKKKFLWTPSYSKEISFNPRTRKINFGPPSTQRSRDGINMDLLKIQLSFENRDKNEVFAICHFLFNTSGKESFLFTPKAPFNKRKLFIVKTFKCVYNYIEDYSIFAEIEEVIR